MSLFESNPRGLFDPDWWRNKRWIALNAAIINGITKWNPKNRFKVALSTANPPHTHSTKYLPKYGIADKILVITVAAQNLIWPQTRTYPIKAAAIVKIKIITPMFQTSINKKEE